MKKIVYSIAAWCQTITKEKLKHLYWDAAYLILGPPKKDSSCLCDTHEECQICYSKMKKYRRH